MTTTLVVWDAWDTFLEPSRVRARACARMQGLQTPVPSVPGHPVHTQKARTHE